jgi:hypothetical protein
MCLRVDRAEGAGRNLPPPPAHSKELRSAARLASERELTLYDATYAAVAESLGERDPGDRYDPVVEKGRRTGNWTPQGEAERAARRRDFQKLTPAQRVEQVFELSRFMSRVSEAGRRRRFG